MNDLLRNLSKGDSYKKISFSKKKILEGVNLIDEAVGSTLGAKGRTVLIQTPQGPYSTKDGYYTSTLLSFKDPEVMLGIESIRQAARRTSDNEGDGTTTCTVLASALVKSAIAIGENPSVEFINGMQAATDDVLAGLDEMTVEMTDTDILKVATTSSNNDAKLGKLISDIFVKYGPDSAVGFQYDPNATETTAIFKDGCAIPLGWSKEEYINDVSKQAVTFVDPYILVCNAEIADAKSIESILRFTSEEAKPLIIIAAAGDKFEAAMMASKIKKGVPVCIIRPDENVDRDLLQDIAAVTGATYFDAASGDHLDTITPEFLGKAHTAMITQYDTLLSINEKPDVSKRLNSVNTILSTTKGESSRRRLEYRKGVLRGGIGSIIIGAATEVEAGEIKDRVEDSVKAIATAMRGGYVPGGGVALLNASSALTPKDESSDDFKDGYVVLTIACCAPYQRILFNAGIDFHRHLDNGYGVNVITGEVENLVESGIIDPASVTKRALSNALSPAITLLRTGAIITLDDKDDEGN